MSAATPPVANTRSTLPDYVCLEVEELIEYIQTWQGEADWPKCTVNVIEALYDVLVMAKMNEAQMFELLGNVGATYMMDLLNTTVLPTADTIGNFEHYDNVPF